MSSGTRSGSEPSSIALIHLSGPLLAVTQSRFSCCSCVTSRVGAQRTDQKRVCWWFGLGRATRCVDQGARHAWQHTTTCQSIEPVSQHPSFEHIVDSSPVRSVFEPCTGCPIGVLSQSFHGVVVFFQFGTTVGSLTRFCSKFVRMFVWFYSMGWETLHSWSSSATGQRLTLHHLT